MDRPVSFGPFTLDVDTRQLLCEPDQRLVHLSPKANELLRVLVETSDRKARAARAALAVNIPSRSLTAQRS